MMDKKFKLPMSKDTYIDFKPFYVDSLGDGRHFIYEMKRENTTPSQHCISVPWPTRGDGLILHLVGETTQEECYLTIGFHKGEVFLNAYKPDFKSIPFEQILEDA